MSRQVLTEADLPPTVLTESEGDLRYQPLGVGAGGGGTTILAGAGAPSPAVGVDGNYYLDQTNHVLYGPKTTGAFGPAMFLTADSDVPATLYPFADYALGGHWRFKVPGQIVGARFWRRPEAAAGPRALRLYDQTGVLKATGNTVGDTAGYSGWVQATFPAPLPIFANDERVVAFDAPAGGYVGTAATPTLTNPAVCTFLGARYGTTAGFPANPQGTGQSYFADIQFQPPGGDIWPVALDPWRRWTGTQAAYDALAVKDPNTLYVIVG